MLYYCIVARLFKQNIMQSTLTKIMNKKTYSFTFLKV